MSMSLAFSNAYELKQANKEYMLNRGAGDSLVTVYVKAGNSLANIAKGANMSLESLRGYNRHFKYDFIPLGKKEYEVYIPYDKLSYFRQNFTDSISHSYFIIYRVKKGDTLSSIARKHNIKVAQIKEINALKSNLLSINQRLTLPVLMNKTNSYGITRQTNHSKKIVRR